MAGLVAAPRDGWAILWPFVSIVASLWILAMLARRSAAQPSGTAESKGEFSATRSWILRGAFDTRQEELLEWMLDQAAHAGWRIPPVVSLAGACQEVVTFLQRTLPEGSAITVKAVLQKGKGVMTVSHEGRPLTLPDYHAAPSLEALDDTSMAGIELRLAAAQVEHMSYQARLSDLQCSFTLRQTC